MGYDNSIYDIRVLDHLYPVQNSLGCDFRKGLTIIGYDYVTYDTRVLDHSYPV